MGKTEYFDIRNEKGEITGEVKERSRVHRDGDLHGTVHIWVVRETEKGYDVLLQKRSSNKDSFPDCYDISSAGHVEAGCDYLESALREMKEELGIEACEQDLEYFGMHEGYVETEFYGKPFKNHEISAMYLYRKPITIEALTLQQEEVSSVMFLDYHTCEKMIKDGTLKHCIYLDEFVSLGEKLGLRK